MNPKTEPARLGTAIIGLVSAALVVAVALGVDIDDAKREAILAGVAGLVAFGASMGVGEWIRSRVSPVTDSNADLGVDAGDM